jgi:hypothetical protein
MRWWAVSALTADVTETLEKKLRAWIENGPFDDDDVQRVALRLDMPEAIEDIGGIEHLYDEALVHADDLYDVIDALLDLMPGHLTADRDELQEYLDDARSDYTIAPDGRGLAHRADPVATAALTDSSNSADSRPDAGSASDHLAAAWAAAFSTHPDGPKSYSESIKAVEAAAHAIAEPNNYLATLGTMYRSMQANSSRYCLNLPAPGVPATPVIDMMALLWHGQTSRHAGQFPTRKETVDEARAAVHLAVVLVQWFSCGTVRRVP